MAILKPLILLGTFLIVALCPGFANAELWLHVSTLKDGSEFYYNSDSVCLVDVRDQNNVAPREGAWIEIPKWI